MKFNGFSLLELLVVLSIVSILVAIAYPCYQGVRQRQQQHQAQLQKQQQMNDRLMQQLQSTRHR